MILAWIEIFLGILGAVFLSIGAGLFKDWLKKVMPKQTAYIGAMLFIVGAIITGIMNSSKDKKDYYTTLPLNDSVTNFKKGTIISENDAQQANHNNSHSNYIKNILAQLPGKKKSIVKHNSELEYKKGHLVINIVGPTTNNSSQAVEENHSWQDILNTIQENSSHSVYEQPTLQDIIMHSNQDSSKAIQ